MGFSLTKIGSGILRSGPPSGQRAYPSALLLSEVDGVEALTVLTCRHPATPLNLMSAY
jgi:hypothetical protein